MADSTKPTPRKQAAKGEVVKTRTQENLSMLVGQLENALPQQFSEKHIDKYFENQNKLYKHIRDDHKDQVDLAKHGQRYLLLGVIAVGVILILVIGIIAYVGKDSLDKFIQLFFAFLGGTGVGAGGITLVRRSGND